MTPRATYRLQFHKEFGFKKAATIASYLGRLGVSHVYASPWLRARPGSSHGYDIVDHHSLNPELGTDADFQAMVEAFQAAGLRQILDFVPNHMGVGGADNPLWLDVLEWGSDSAYAGWFDIDWRPDPSYLRDKLLVPFLGDQYGVELYNGELSLRFDEQDGSFAVWAYESHKLPICPLHYGRILGDAHPELERLGDAFASLPEWRPQVGRRARELKVELAHSARERRDVQDAIANALGRFRGVAGKPEGWADLHALIQNQYWRAANFRVASDDINYRRFFNINDLAGLRMELPEVFEHAHSLVFRLLADGTLDGLRIDHVDGLLEPKEYFCRLRSRHEAVRSGESFYLLVEKILAHHESLREDWPVDGTTGYEFANLVLGLLVEPAGEEDFTRTYVEFTGERNSFAGIVRDCKLRIMKNEMASELNMLAADAERVAHQNPRTADFTFNVLRRAIRQVVACFPVYRTYVDSEGSPSDEDRRDLSWAMIQARAKEPDIDPSVFDFVHNLLTGDLVAAGRSGFSRHAVLRCAMKFQQYSGPVMAKGLEDTAFYRYNRFVALNEVGGHPDQFGVTLSHFHKANAQRLATFPNSMLSTSTHDTKRGEDTRARLAALSGMHDEWSRQVHAWSRILRARRNDIAAAAPPDRNEEYLFYQLLVGTWPAELTGRGSDLDPSALKVYADRLKGAMTKSLREARVHSTWASPDSEYEDAVSAFVDCALQPDKSSAFFSAFLPFQERVARLGVHNSLVQTALKLTVPGVPDIYQGAELWDLSLVDPDNRRPVDYENRMNELGKLADTSHGDGSNPMKDLLDQWQSGVVKLALISRILAFRAAVPELFASGDYEPLAATGPKADCICAFARCYEDRLCVILTARFPERLSGDRDWLETRISLPSKLGDRQLRDVLCGGALPVSKDGIDAEKVFAGLPVALFC